MFGCFSSNIPGIGRRGSRFGLLAFKLSSCSPAATLAHEKKDPLLVTRCFDCLYRQSNLIESTTSPFSHLVKLTTLSTNRTQCIPLRLGVINGYINIDWRLIEKLFVGQVQHLSRLNKIRFNVGTTNEWIRHQFMQKLTVYWVMHSTIKSNSPCRVCRDTSARN